MLSRVEADLILESDGHKVHLKSDKNSLTLDLESPQTLRVLLKSLGLRRSSVRSLLAFDDFLRRLQLDLTVTVKGRKLAQMGREVNFGQRVLKKLLALQ